MGSGDEKERSNVSDSKYSDHEAIESTRRRSLVDFEEVDANSDGMFDSSQPSPFGACHVT